MSSTYTKITYKGVTETISSNPFEEIDIKVSPPNKSNKFDKPSLYYKGIYYFYQDIQKTINEICKEDAERSAYRNAAVWERLHKGWLFTITIGYHNHKWIQDKEYITQEFKDFLLSYIKTK
jgi:hypothetical protein